MPGPPPKPAHLRQRRNKKVGAGTLEAPVRPLRPEIPNPDGRTWHPLTLKSWANAWASPMATRWLQVDADALGRLAVLLDDFYKRPNAEALKEIRLQSALFGLSPLDRSRLQWETSRTSDAEKRAAKRTVKPAPAYRRDPRSFLTPVK